MNLREVLDAVRATWWLLPLGAVAGAVLALVLALVQTPLYTSSTQLFVSTTAASSTLDAVQGREFSEARVQSYARLLTGRDLAGRIVERLDVDTTEGEVQDSITAAAVPGTVLIDVSVTDPRPERAQAVAEAVGQEFPGLVSDIEAPVAGGEPLVRVTVTDAPQLPTAPSSPDRFRYTALGIVLGLVLGVLAAVARRRMDRTVKVPDQAAELVGAPVIGTVLKDASLETRHVADSFSPGRAAEDYRLLRTNLQFLQVDEPPKVIMITSPAPGEGKTTAAVNLGLALADSGRRVTVIEADLRRPKVTRYLGLVSGVGLTNVLAGTADVEDVVQQYGDSGLSVIGAGPLPPNPGELLASTQMAALLEKLRGDNDFVLIDTPPVLPVADSVGLAVLVDGVLVSVRYGRTLKEHARQVGVTLERVGATVLGLILNIVPPKAELVATHGYGLEYGYDGARPARHKA
ncbi:polysaccharide biosynthesis tyrosine autokinase [Geodermatophilus saharensis]|nr:polysaccharide biosynthesis tyrosine autokinase [Geodermatophilus saharensis]